MANWAGEGWDRAGRITIKIMIKIKSCRFQSKAPEKTGAVQKPRQFGGFIPYSAIVLWKRLGIVFLVYTFFFMTLDREVLCHGDDLFDL